MINIFNYKEFLQEKNNISNNIKIYHRTDSLADAISIMKNGYDVKQNRRTSAEGVGMGASFSPNILEHYGRIVIEFKISTDDFKKYIIIDNGVNKNKEILELTENIYGYNKNLKDQINDIEPESMTNYKVIESIEKGWYPEDLLAPTGLGINPNSIGKHMKGFVTCQRFIGILSIHLYDPSIAKPTRYSTDNTKTWKN